METSGFRLKRAKCLFFLKSIDYLGHTISPDGLSPNEKKVQAIRAAPRPVDVGQLRSFLGLVNYYGKFLPNLASTLALLYLLLHKHTDWRWGIDQSRAFEQAKGLLTSCILLVHFDPDKELLVSCDASPYGLGAVLSHRMEDGSSKPIYYASRTLSAPERGYSQLDKEGLAIIFAVKKFHTFLHGRHFTIISDHKPLQCILGHRKPVPTLASARLQRWALLLGAYDYKLEYMSACQLRHADGLSRLPLPESPANTPVPGETILLVDNMELSSLSFRKVRQMTDSDKVLSRVRLSLQRGWGIFEPYLHWEIQRRHYETTKGKVFTTYSDICPGLNTIYRHIITITEWWMKVNERIENFRI